MPIVQTGTKVGTYSMYVACAERIAYSSSDPRRSLFALRFELYRFKLKALHSLCTLHGVYVTGSNTKKIIKRLHIYREELVRISHRGRMHCTEARKSSLYRILGTTMCMDVCT